MRTTPESFKALVDEALREVWRLVPLPWTWGRLCVHVDDRDHRGAVRLLVPHPWPLWRETVSLRRKHIQALATDDRQVYALVLHLFVQHVGRLAQTPECCLNRLAPWPADVRCP